jgi:TBC1 domain family member 5
VGLISANTSVQRNLPDLAAQAASFVRTPISPGHQQDAFPLAGERPLEQERPPWEPRTRFEMERDISELKSANRQCGKALGWIVDALLQDEDDNHDPEKVKSIKQRKRDALESLAYVRDILSGNVTEIESDRLISEETQRVVRDAIVKQANATGDTAPPTSFMDAKQISPPQPVAPLPLPTADSRPSGSRMSSQWKTSASIPQTVPQSPMGPAYAASSSAPGFQRFNSPQVKSPLTSDKNATPLAPWNYTSSGFGAVSSALPLPPPASTAPWSPHTSSAGTKTPLMSPPLPNPLPPDTGRVSGRTVSHDPLGAIP